MSDKEKEVRKVHEGIGFKEIYKGGAKPTSEKPTSEKPPETKSGDGKK